jgi:hypothetical protein
MKIKMMNWPNDFDGAHSIGSAKIYESPDKGKTVYERDFGSDPSTRKVIKTSIQQQWNITFRGEQVAVPQNLANLI